MTSLNETLRSRTGETPGQLGVEERYAKAKSDTMRRTVARLSRGNVRMQQGAYMTSDELRTLSEKGRASIAFLDSEFGEP